MNCESVGNVEDLYQEGRLTPPRAEQVRAHIKDCPACAAKLKNDVLLLKRATGPTCAEAPKDLKERMRKMLAEAKPVPEPEPVFRFDGEMWPVVASVAVYLGLALLLAWWAPGVPSEKYGTGYAPVEATK